MSNVDDWDNDGWDSMASTRQQNSSSADWSNRPSQTFTNTNFRGRGGRSSRGNRRGGRADNHTGNRSSNSGGNWGNDNQRRGQNDGWADNNSGNRSSNSSGGWGNDNQSSGKNDGWADDNTGNRSNNSRGGWADDNTGGRSSNSRGGWGNDDQSSGKNDGWGDNRGNNQRRSKDDKCEIIKVPSRLVGKIIGRGGSMIEELQIRSSAQIRVTKDTEGDDTLVKIIGDDSSIATAKERINELVEDKPKAPPPKPASPPPPKVEFGPNYTWRQHMEKCEREIKAEWDALPPIVKVFYEEHPEVTAMTDEEVEQFREDSNNIVVERTFPKPDSRPIPRPITKFYHAFHNYPEILDEIKKVGFETPSPIQSQAWPVLLTGEDMIGIAQTGTGKTLAFLLPALLHIDGQTIPREERGGPAVLIMAPTRELALQIDREVKKYHYRGITSTCVYGGGDRKTQVEVVSRGVDIVIATPGRMNDLYEAGHLAVKTVTYVVLDEADRMLDMGFEPQIRKVMYAINPYRQSIMTSATWPPGVRRLADSYMNDPIQVYVGSLDLAATHTVTQIIQIVEQKEKEDLLYEFINNMGPDDKIICFCGTKALADYLAVELLTKNVNCASLHSNLDQADRERAVEDIKNGSVNILVATDVASRGLDIDDVTHVINYDFPRNIEEYVHRVGRTGRAGKSGESISFFTKNDWGQAAELIKILEEAQQYVPEELFGMAERFQAMQERKQNSREPRRGAGRFGGNSRRF